MLKLLAFKWLFRWFYTIKHENFQNLKNNIFTYFKYPENDGGIYFAHKYIYVLQKNISFR